MEQIWSTPICYVKTGVAVRIEIFQFQTNLETVATLCWRFWWITNSGDSRGYQDFSKRFLSVDIKTSSFFMRHHFHHYIQYELLLKNYCKFTSWLVFELLIRWQKHLAEWNLVIYLQICTYPSPTGFDTAFTNVEATLKQRPDKVSSMLCCFNVQRWTPTLYLRCATLKIRCRILFHFQRQINVERTIKQRWFDVEMLTGWGLRKPRKDKYQNYSHIGPAYISLSQSKLTEWFKLSFSKPIRKKWGQRLLGVINQLSHKLYLLW